MAAKEREFTNVERFYLDNHPNNEPSELAEFLNCTEEKVKKYFEGKRTGVYPIGDTMITESRNGRKGIAVMTQAASEIADETRRNTLKKNPNDPSFVFQCKGKKKS